MKKILANLFKTYIFSLVISIALCTLYTTVLTKYIDHDFGHLIPALISGCFIINIILLVMALPVLFLAYPQLQHQAMVRLLLYFSGPVVFIMTIFNVNLKAGDFAIYLITGLTFLLVHAFFYYQSYKQRLVK